MIEIDRLGEDVVRVSATTLHNVEITRHPGGGLCLTATTPDAQTVTIDGFPIVENGSKVVLGSLTLDRLLESTGGVLGMRLEVETATEEIPAGSLDDVTACPDPLRISLVPDLAMGDS